MTIELMDFERRRHVWIAAIMMVVLVFFVGCLYPEPENEEIHEKEEVPVSPVKKRLPDTKEILNQKPPSDPSIPQEIQQISNGIQWLVTPGETREERIIKVYQDTRAFQDSEYRIELAEAFIGAAEKFNFSTWLLVGMGYRESIFRMDEIGDGGKAHGIMQVHGQGHRACALYCKDMSTAREQIECGACWLDKGRQWCGDLDGGLFAYICGGCSTIVHDRRRAFRIRKKLERVLSERFGEV